MSSVFEAVKRMVSVPVAAEDCGLEVNSAGMVRCPFHEDHTPSMKLYMDHFYCFGCGKHGDVIDLIAGLAGITPYEAALNLAEAYHVDVENLPDQRPVDLAAKAELKRFQEGSAPLSADTLRVSALAGGMETALRAARTLRRTGRPICGSMSDDRHD